MARTWKPTPMMRALLEAAQRNPTASVNEWAKTAEVSRRTVSAWFGKGTFVQWWNREMMSPVRDLFPRVVQALFKRGLADEATIADFQEIRAWAEKFNFGGIREEERKDAANAGHSGKSVNINVNLTPEANQRRLERPVEVVEAKFLEHDE